MWEVEKDWAIQHTKSGFPSTLYKLAMAGAVYHIWKARSEGIFCNKFSDPSSVCSNVIQDVRDRVSSWTKVGASNVNRDLCRA